MSRLLLLDGHSLAYRAFFALPAENFSTVTGQHTNAVYGFTSMLINMLRDEQPTHVLVAFDKARQSFRTEEYSEYKAGRARTPDEFSGQLPVLYVREGNPREELIKLINEEPQVSILVLAADTGPGGPGPLVSALTGKFVGRLRVPITIVPGHLSNEQIAAIT